MRVKVIAPHEGPWAYDLNKPINFFTMFNFQVCHSTRSESLGQVQVNNLIICEPRSKVAAGLHTLILYAEFDLCAMYGSLRL